MDSDEPSGALVDGGAEQLIEFFGANPAVRAYAMKSLDWRRPPLAQAAVALADDPEARQRIVDLIQHLPLLLRRQIVEELSSSIDEEFAQSILHRTTPRRMASSKLRPRSPTSAALIWTAHRRLPLPSDSATTSGS